MLQYDIIYYQINQHQKLTQFHQNQNDFQPTQ